jgi:DNA-binding transcriptional regulator YhcF (GntR family)
MLDLNSDVPLYRQVSRQIAQAIQSGELENGTRLPSSRMMAKLLRVSRNTILVAYQELTAAGLTISEPGAATRVDNTAPPIGVRPMRIQTVIRAACFPSKIISFTDLDGNALYLNF